MLVTIGSYLNSYRMCRRGVLYVIHRKDMCVAFSWWVQGLDVCSVFGMLYGLGSVNMTIDETCDKIVLCLYYILIYRRTIVGSILRGEYLIRTSSETKCWNLLYLCYLSNTFA